MKRLKWNYWIDVLLFTLMVAVSVIGVLLGFFTTEGPVADQSEKYVWDLHRHQWGDIHLWLSLALVALVIVHVVLHWSWVKASTRKLVRSISALLGISALPFLAIFLVWGLSDKSAGEYERFGTRPGRRHDISAPAAKRVNTDLNGGPASTNQVSRVSQTPGAQPRQVEVNGRMSLNEVARQTGVSARSIAKEIGLPAGVSLNTNLGRLRRSHKFAIEEVRKAVGKFSGGKVVAVDSDAVAHEHSHSRGNAPPANIPTKAAKDYGHRSTQGSGRGLGKRRGRGLRQDRDNVDNRHRDQHQRLIHGQLSLLDVEKLTGLPARELADRLQLPAEIHLDATLGSLRKRYGFSMQDVRAVVNASKANKPRGSRSGRR